jgi:hypothetical protein
MKHLLTMGLLAALAASCGTGTAHNNGAAAATPSGPSAIDVVEVVERPLDVELSLPWGADGLSDCRHPRARQRIREERERRSWVEGAYR